MRLIIIEDELFAFKELERMLIQLIPDMQILAHFDSVEAAVNGMHKYKADLIFLDISLPDGTSFDVLNQCQIDTPVIFTTAYDEFAIKAFKYNSIDYLLKPIDANDLDKAIQKYQSQKQNQNLSLDVLGKLFPNKSGKKRFMVRLGDQYSHIDIDDIAYFYSEDKISFIRNFNNNNFICDYSLSEIEDLVDDHFHRVSRNMICSIDSIASSHKYYNSRLRLKLNPPYEKDILISRVKVKEFLDWLDK